ncbi:MAG TPA: DUF1080 domain-containing protein [Planctomycetaceae bacterium]|nr:DUF1080 domain-containing protein [Planctomycetaceae bacterium]
MDTLLHGDVGVSTEPKSLVGQDVELTTLGRYEVLGELGRGGMGAVYLANDTILKRKVALKIPQFEPSKAEPMKARFRREAEMAAQLNHPNICQVYDVSEIDGRFVMAMEYIPGRTLATYTKPDKLLGTRQAVMQVRRVAQTMELAHQRGLIHRDLKPGNIMLFRPDPNRKTIEPKIMDFGLAKRAESQGEALTKTGEILGTPCYMSKEQWSARETELGPSVDIYSLGVILYELLTGKLPFDVHPEEPPTTWFVRLVTDKPTKPSQHKPGIDSALEQIVMKAIAVEPEDRFASMAELATALEKWLKGKPAEVLPERAVELASLNLKLKPQTKTFAGRKKSRNWGLIACGFGGLAVLALGIIIKIKSPDGTTRVVETDGNSAEVTPGPGDIVSVSVSGEQEANSNAHGAGGWISLFDGKDVTYWSDLGPFHVKDGLLVANNQNGYAVSSNEYGDFEFEADWRIGEKGNSGIYYRELPSTTRSGTEYQIIDNDGYRDVMKPELETASLWSVVRPLGANPQPLGEWNQTRIVCRGPLTQHWLNGTQVLEYDTTSSEWHELKKLAEKDVSTIGIRNRGYILLQSLGGEIAFRSIRIRELSAKSDDSKSDDSNKDADDAQWVPLFNDHDLSGWDVVHGATIDWTNRNGTITGRNRSNQINSGGSLQTHAQFANFHFRCEVLAGASDGGIISFRNNGSRITGAHRGYAVLNPAAGSPLELEGWGIGSLYADKFQVPLQNTRLAQSTVKDPGIQSGDWYALDILAQDEAVEIRINNKTTTQFTSTNAANTEAGAYSMSCPRGATVTFRNLEIRPLTARDGKPGRKVAISHLLIRGPCFNQRTTIGRGKASRRLPVVPLVMK